MARRYIGRATVTVIYRDGGYYDCTVAVDGTRWTGQVNPPAAGYGPGVAYDSPEAHDSVASAAASFASTPAPDVWREQGLTVHDAKRRLRDALEYGGIGPDGWIVLRKQPLPPEGK